MIKLFSLLLVLAVLLSCQSNRLKVDVSSVDLTLKLSRLDHELFAVNSQNIATQLPQIQKSYGQFFEAYNENVLGLGNSTDPAYENYLKTFLTDSIRQASVKQIDSVYSDLTELKQQLELGFKHYKYYFPNKTIPTIITLVSGFNQSIVLTSDAIGLSLDNYLGSSCTFYKQLGIPAYKRENMIREKIPADIIYAWGISEFGFDESKVNLISQMIYQGKMMFFVDAMLPDEADNYKIGYTPDKLAWCAQSEASMWTYLIEHKMLFSSDRMNIVRFINPAPFTSCFTADSPGRTGVWMGWQIVRAYMKKHPEISIPELMAENDYQKILNESGYSPE